MMRKEKRREKREAAWKDEAESLRKYREHAAQRKQLAIAHGYPHKFFDYLDSWEGEFNNVVAEIKAKHPEVTDVVVTGEKFVVRDDWTVFGIPKTWEHVLFQGCDSSHNDNVGSLDEKHKTAQGVVQTFLDDAKSLRLLVCIAQSVKSGNRHREFLYLARLVYVLHEYGHVLDILCGRHFQLATRTADPLESEVSAHMFSFTECRRRGYILGAKTILGTMNQMANGQGFQRRVGKTVLERLDTKLPKTWEDYIPDAE